MSKHLKWSEEKIREFVAENPDVTSRKELFKKKASVYYAARKYPGLMDSLFGNPKHKRREWTRKDIVQLIKDNHIHTLADLRRISMTAYMTAMHWDGFFEEQFKEKAPRELYWTQDRIMEYVNTNGFETRNEFKRDNPAAYRSALRIKGLLDTIFGEAAYDGRPVYWSRKRLKEFVAARPEIKNRTDLAKANRSAYNRAIKTPGILDELFPIKRGKKIAG